MDDGFNLVKSEVNNVQERLDDDSDAMKRQNNIMIFGLGENESLEEDKKSVAKMLQHLSGVTSDIDVNYYLKRLGKKDDKTIRPLLICFRDIMFKNAIMKNLGRIRDLDECYHKVSIRHDLTPDQRSVLNKLLIEAKNKETNNKKGFLFRVRGEINQWRIVGFKKSS